MKGGLRRFGFGVLIGFIGILAVGALVSRNLATEGAYNYIRLFNEALARIREAYVEEVHTDSLMKGAYEGMLAELDPSSEYMTSDEYAAYQEMRARRGTGGRIADVGIRVAKRGELVVVVSVWEGSDAREKGIGPGDLIRRIGDRPVRELGLDEVERSLSGRPGDKVSVGLYRREEPRRFDADLVVREPAAAHPMLSIADAKEGIAVLTVPHFDPGMANELADALARAGRQKVRRLLLDLRGNAWGQVTEAASAAGLFVGDSVVAEVKGRQGGAEPIRAGRARAPFDGVVAVLMNGSTAEAAELFAAALKDGRGATMLGETSFGVGAQQEIIPLENGAYLKLSVRKYTSKSGSAWHGEGIKPDVIVAVNRDGLKPAERSAEQLRRAVDQVRKLQATAAPRAA